MEGAFSFDFLAPKKDNSDYGSSISPMIQNDDDADIPTTTETQSFTWLDNLQSRILAAIDNNWSYEEVSISDKVVVRSVREKISSSKGLQGTDLVPGVYEGGLKVWECSIDLCRYLAENNIGIDGHVLELGCGQGLPGCWMLTRLADQLSAGNDSETQSWAGSTAPIAVVFSDYNEFVLTDVTIPNIAVNLKDSVERSKLQGLLQYVAMGFGDWNAMSDQLLSQPSKKWKDGKFDMILAAETTYSSQAASDTALLLVKHLKVNTGVAFIATKRYYFGVGGGSESFKAALSSAQPQNVKFNVETAMVYDSGTGNIRELLKVYATSVSDEICH